MYSVDDETLGSQDDCAKRYTIKSLLSCVVMIRKGRSLNLYGVLLRTESSPKIQHDGAPLSPVVLVLGTKAPLAKLHVLVRDDHELLPYGVGRIHMTDG